MRSRNILVMWTIVLFGILIISPSLSRQAHAESAQRAWVATYNGPENHIDQPNSLAVDGSGNVYVTGSSEGVDTDRDCTTIKYGPDGNELWVARYNGPANGSDGGGNLAVDGSGNVYVTGSSEGVGTDYDYATVKYDPDGAELWVARYDGPGNQRDYVSSPVVVDTAGNVYVTGRSDGVGTDYDYATVKYDPDGAELWVARYNGPGNGEDRGQSLAVDGSGNVYVTGGSNGLGTGWDFATIKYDGDGNELWVARYDGPVSGDDRYLSNGYLSLAVDDLGNVYVTGYSVGDGTGSDYATIKYDADGNELWAARYDGPGGLHDYPSSLAVDESGNVYVTGRCEGDGTNDDYATIKYDTDGNELWVAHHDGVLHEDDRAVSVALDPLGNVYVSGTSVSKTYCFPVPYPPYIFCFDSHDIFTIKYNPDGRRVWRIGHKTLADHPFFVSLAVDALGNVYVAGSLVDPSTSMNWVTVKYIQVAGGGWQAAQSVEASTIGSESIHKSHVLNYFFILLVPGFILGIRKVLHR